MESQGLIEFRYTDGAVVTGEYAKYSARPLVKGDELEYGGENWLMYDREDRGGVTVHLFTPTDSAGAAKSSRARSRRRGTG